MGYRWRVYFGFAGLLTACGGSTSQIPAVEDSGGDAEASIEDSAKAEADAAAEADADALRPDTEEEDSPDSAMAIVDVTTGDMVVAAGVEQTLCVETRLPNDAPVEMVQVGADMTPGADRAILFQDPATQESTTPSPCSMIVDIGNAQFDGGTGLQPLLVAQQATTKLDFLQGIGHALGAHQMMRLEVHVWNDTLDPMTTRVTAHVGVVSPGAITEHANVFLYGPGQGQLTVPPGNVTSTTYYPFNHAQPPHLFAAATLTHRLSVGTSVGLGTEASPTVVYQGTNWANPPLKVFDPPLIAGASDGLQLNCAWNNTTGMTVNFGDSSKTDEMCLVWGYFYPDTGPDVRVFP